MQGLSTKDVRSFFVLLSNLSGHTHARQDITISPLLDGSTLSDARTHRAFDCLARVQPLLDSSLSVGSTYCSTNRQICSARPSAAFSTPFRNWMGITTSTNISHTISMPVVETQARPVHLAGDSFWFAFKGRWRMMN